MLSSSTSQTSPGPRFNYCVLARNRSVGRSLGLCIGANSEAEARMIARHRTRNEEDFRGFEYEILSVNSARQ